MTDNQIEKERAMLYGGKTAYEFYQTGKKLSPKKQKRYIELQCLSMINSILAYSWADDGSNEANAVLQRDLNSYHSYLAQYVKKLGQQRVLELIDEQIHGIKGVRRGVFQDNEGCIYNEIIFKED